MSVELVSLHTEHPQTPGTLVRPVDVPQVPLDLGLLREAVVAHGTRVAEALVLGQVQVEARPAAVAPPTQRAGEGRRLAVAGQHVVADGCRGHDGLVAHVAAGGGGGR